MCKVVSTHYSGGYRPVFLFGFNCLNINKMTNAVIFVIQSANTVFDLAGMISACLPNTSVLLTAVSGGAFIPALSVTVREHIPCSRSQAARRYQHSVPLYRQHMQHHLATTSAVKHVGRFKNGIFHR
jgi:hypothetical protein